MRLPPGDPNELFDLWAKCIECKREYNTRNRVSRHAWETGKTMGNTERCPHCGFDNTYGGEPDYMPRPVKP
jgi:DNA-directed RNA polymerase subunit RPC12/RpoP